MDGKTKALIQKWLDESRDDESAVARFISRTLGICGMKAARAMVREAR
jgi:hypothetical protein